MCFLCYFEFFLEVVSDVSVIFFVLWCGVFNHSFVQLMLFFYQFIDFIFYPGVAVVFVVHWKCVVFFDCSLQGVGQCGEFFFDCVFSWHVGQVGGDVIVDCCFVLEVFAGGQCFARFVIF